MIALHLQLYTRTGAHLCRLLWTGRDRWRTVGRLSWRNEVPARLSLLLSTLYLLVHLSMTVLRVLFNLMIEILDPLYHWNRGSVAHLLFKKDSVSPCLHALTIGLPLGWRND